uniref:Uncharacterized protein n=1 Tax=Parastrongyloides trichosuri TaxID=131310 RepID=A0A0N4ZW83_PARTI
MYYKIFYFLMKFKYLCEYFKFKSNLIVLLYLIYILYQSSYLVKRKVS